MPNPFAKYAEQAEQQERVDYSDLFVQGANQQQAPETDSLLSVIGKSAEAGVERFGAQIGGARQRAGESGFQSALDMNPELTGQLTRQVQLTTEEIAGLPKAGGMELPSPQELSRARAAKVQKAIQRIQAELPEVKAGREQFQQHSEAAAESRPNVDDGSFKYYLGAATETMVGNVLPMMATALITRSPNLALGLMGGQVYGEKYAEQREKGRSEDESNIDALFYAASEAITEKIPLSIVLKRGKPFLKKTLHGTVAEGGQEVFNEALQIGYELGVLDEKTDLKTAMRRMVDAGIIGGMVGGGMAAVAAPFTKKETVADEPTPETDATLKAQLDAFGEGRKRAVLFTPGEPVPEDFPPGSTVEELDGGKGVLLYQQDDPQALELANSGKLGEVLGYGINKKPEGSDHVVTARDDQGRVVQEVVTDGRQKVLDEAQQAAGPGGTVEERTAADALTERQRERRIEQQNAAKVERRKTVRALTKAFTTGGIDHRTFVSRIQGVYASQAEPVAHPFEDMPAGTVDAPVPGEDFPATPDRLQNRMPGDYDVPVGRQSERAQEPGPVSEPKALPHKSPDPFISMPDGTVARKSDIDQKIAALSDAGRWEEAAALKAKSLGYPGELGSAERAERSTESSLPEGVEPGDVLTSKQRTFKTKSASAAAIKRHSLKDHEPVKIKSGWVARPGKKSDKQVERALPDKSDVNKHPLKADKAQKRATKRQNSDPVKAAVEKHKTRAKVISYLRGRYGKSRLPEFMPRVDELLPAQKGIDESEINDAAHEAATSPKNDLPQPTESQKEAGNYKVGKISLNGLNISIENPAGSKRRPEWPALKHHYGYIRKTEGADGDHVDVFLTNEAGNTDYPVFVVDQVDPKTWEFDEHKVVIGSPDVESGKQVYLANYEKGWQGLGAIKQFTLDEFKTWLGGDTTKPVALRDNKAFDRFVSVLETKETDQGTALFSRKRGWFGFPDAVIAHRSSSSHPDYKAAKAGDFGAAMRLARDLVTPEYANSIKQSVGGSRPIIVPVRSIETEGAANAIPEAVAQVLAKRAGLTVDDGDIIQRERIGRGDSDGFYRLANQPTFEGAVLAKEYIILDDTLTQGGTLAQLKDYIEDHGGRVVLATTLTGKQYSAKIALSDKLLRDLRNGYGELENWWKSEFGYGFEGLTESEARYILKSGLSPDEFRSRLVKARGEGTSSPGTADDSGGVLKRIIDHENQSQQARPSAGLSASEVRAAIKPRWDKMANKVPVEVVEDYEDLPPAVYQKIQDEGVDIEGVAYKGHIYLVANQISSVERAQAVFFDHELRHVGLHALLGKKINPFLNQVWMGREHAKVKAFGEKLGIDTRTAKGKKEAAEEYVVNLAETGQKNNLLQRLYALLRDFVRSIGLDVKFSDVDLRQIVANAGTLMEKGRDAPVFSKSAGAAAMASRKASMFYSQMQRVLTEKLNASGSAYAYKKQIQSFAKKGMFKQEELEWSGIEEWLDSLLGKKLTKDQVLDFLLANEVDTPLFSRQRVTGTEAQEAAIAATIDIPENEKSWRQRVKEAVQRIRDIDGTELRQGFIDEFASIEALEEGAFGKLVDARVSPSKAARRTKNLDSVMAAMMLKGPLEYVDGAFQIKVGGKGFTEIFDNLSKKGLLHLWEGWAAANRANRLMKEGREHNFTQAQINELLKLEAQYPEFRTVLNEYQAFNKGVLDMAETVGVIDWEARNLWEQNDYVPFYRAMEDILSGEVEVKGPRNKRGLSGQSSGIKALRGGEEKIGSVIENMVLNAAHLVDASFKTVALRRVVNLAESSVMEKVEAGFQPVGITTGQMITALRKAGILPSPDLVNAVYGETGVKVGQLSSKERRQYLKLFRRVAPAGNDIISVMKNGKPEYYRVTDPLLLRSMTSMGVRNVQGMMKLMRGSKRLLTAMVTADPAFMAANFIRDTLSTAVVSHTGLKPGVDAVKGFKDALKEDPALLAIMAAGGGGGGYYHATPAEMRQNMHHHLNEIRDKQFRETVLDSPKKLWRAWQKIGAASENANRIAIFKAVKKRGGSTAEAVHQAQDILNFTQNGDFAAMRFLIETVPFMNARIQGLDRLYRGYKEDPRGFVIKGMMITAATLALLARNWDDDEYDELPEWDKDIYWHFFLGDKDKNGRSEYHFRLPKPFEVGAIFGTIPERFARGVSGKDDSKILAQTAGRMLGETFAMNPIPQIFKPVVEQYSNKTFFTGSPIIGAGMQRLKPEAQYDPWTSESMRGIAEIMPDWAPEWLRSPKRLQTALRGYLGTVGIYAVEATDKLIREIGDYPGRPSMRVDDVPVAKRFVRGTPPRSTKYTNQFYDMVQDANEVYSTVKRYREQGRIEAARELAKDNAGKLRSRKALNRMARRITVLNNRIKRVYSNREMSPDKKREIVDKLTEQKQKLVRGADHRFKEQF